MSKVKAIVDPHFRQMNAIFSPDDQSELYQLVDVIWGKDEPIPQELFLEALPEAEVIICGEWRYGNVLAKAPNLRTIFVVSGSFPLNFDYEYCYQHHIRVLSVAPAFARQVAEMCLGLALASCREIVACDRDMRNGQELYLRDGNKTTFMLYDQPVGIVGYGSIARELHPLLYPFNVKVSVYDPWLGKRYLRSQGVEPVPLDDLMANSRFIFVLAPPTTENQAMLSREYLELIQSNAVLILASRAHVVDFEAMTEMVLAGRFKVATDVFPTEPLDQDHPICNASDAILSAHRAGSVREGTWELGAMVLDDLEAVLAGLPPQRLQLAQPELSYRFALNRAKEPGEDGNT